jgi:pyruvate dehydrogenase E2 component (dihydrolipoamide acetyltransferase)
MEEGTIARWLKHPGDRVARGEVIAEIETDKATMDLEAYDDGVVVDLLVDEGATVGIGEPVATIDAGTGGPAQAQRPAPAVAQAPAPAGAPPGRPEPAAAAPTAVSPPPVQGPPRAAPRSSPLARSLAGRHGLDLARIPGTGPGGRIVRADVEDAIAHQTPAPPATVTPTGGEPRPAPVVSTVSSDAADDEEIPLNKIRRVTAERLTESAQAPHFYLTVVVEADRLLSLRTDINEALDHEGAKVSVTDLLLAACARALRSHPEINASWGGDRIIRHRRIHIGMATATDAGLVVPVVHDADSKSLAEIAVETRTLADRARAGRLTLDDLAGGTFTISNLGMYGVDHFTAVINPPQAAILAVGAASSEPVVRDGAIVPATTIKMTLTVDHRVLDGAAGAVFLATLRRILERPVAVLL